MDDLESLFEQVNGYLKDNPEPVRRCSRCKDVKPESCFYKRSPGCRGKLSARCKSCDIECNNARRWMERHPRAAVLYSRNYQKANPEKIAAAVAARKAESLKRTPVWADKEAIKEFYEAARRRSKETGVPHEVDHVIPLQGDLVSGLHVQNNLRVVPAVVNQHKHNFFNV